jgi:acyl-CoA synthetase (AMP-forming)/AMP-acid ligase II
MTIRNLRDIEALEAQPLSSHRLPRTSYEALAATAARTPDAKALSFFLSADACGQAFVWTYADLLADVTRAANAFHELGVAPEHPVAFVLPNLPETHFVIWGGEAAGAALAINPYFEPAQIANLMKTACARVLVTLAPNRLVDLWTKLAPCLDALPDLKTVALVDAMSYAGARAPPRDLSAFSLAGVDVVDFRDRLQAQPADRLLARQATSSDTVCSYFCTGGTTGAPKIAVRTHRNEIFDAWGAAQMVETRQSPRATFCGLPLFHVNAQLITGLQAWMRGDHVVLAKPEGYRGKNVIARFWEIVAHYRVTTFSGVPTIFSALMNVPISGADISSLEFAICGAAPMPAKLIADFESKTGLKIIEGYGLTEGGCVSSVNPSAGERRAGSIGLRIPYHTWRKEAGADSCAAVIVRRLGGAVMSRAWRQRMAAPRETRARPEYIQETARHEISHAVVARALLGPGVVRRVVLLVDGRGFMEFRASAQLSKNSRRIIAAAPSIATDRGASPTDFEHYGSPVEWLEARERARILLDGHARAFSSLVEALVKLGDLPGSLVDIAFELEQKECRRADDELRWRDSPVQGTEPEIRRRDVIWQVTSR